MTPPKIFKSASSSRPDRYRPRFSTSPRLAQVISHSRGFLPLLHLHSRLHWELDEGNMLYPLLGLVPGATLLSRAGECSELPRAWQGCGPQSGLMSDIVVRSDLRLVLEEKQTGAQGHLEGKKGTQDDRLGNRNRRGESLKGKQVQAGIILKACEAGDFDQNLQKPDCHFAESGHAGCPAPRTGGPKTLLRLISQGLQGVYGPNALRSLENAILPESARRNSDERVCGSRKFTQDRKASRSYTDLSKCVDITPVASGKDAFRNGTSFLTSLFILLSVMSHMWGWARVPGDTVLPADHLGRRFTPRKVYMEKISTRIIFPSVKHRTSCHVRVGAGTSRLLLSEGLLRAVYVLPGQTPKPPRPKDYTIARAIKDAFYRRSSTRSFDVDTNVYRSSPLDYTGSSYCLYITILEDQQHVFGLQQAENTILRW
ncbi:hypothetical protein EV401DRAFT_1883737 [Pisolithus croceorrhizus]|nr:hypothetical protein EV401DRAFT_1883737 [Pisolithus croceorrhizus]